MAHVGLPDVLLIDDLRDFRDPGVPVAVARTSAEGIAALERARSTGHTWAQVWLDHDLGGDDTIPPVVDWLCSAASDGGPAVADTLVVHTSNSVGGDRMVRALTSAGYRVLRLAAPEYLHVGEAAAPQSSSSSSEGGSHAAIGS